MQHLASALSLAQRLALWQLLLLAGGMLLWSQRRLAPGALRVAVALPLLALNLAAPLLFDGEAELILNISSFIATAAVTNMKVGPRGDGEPSQSCCLLSAEPRAPASPPTPCVALLSPRHAVACSC